MTEFKCMIKKDKNSIWKNTQCTIGESNKMKCVKKLLAIIMVCAIVCSLAGCRSSQQANLPTASDVASSESIQPQQDWREDADISVKDTALFGGEQVPIVGCVENDRIRLYRDAAEQELLAQADYPIPLENAAEKLTTCEFEDLDGDGNSELTLAFDFPEGERASFLWFWVDGQGYTLNEEFSQLPGDSSTGDSLSTIPEAYSALLDCYSEAISETWDSAALMDANLPYLLTLVYGENPLENIGYAISDVEGDGSPELLIGSLTGDEYFGKMIFALYTLNQDGAVSLLFESGEKNRYYYVGENRFANLGQFSANEYFETTLKLEDSEMIDMTYTTQPADYVQFQLQPFSVWGT